MCWFNLCKLFQCLWVLIYLLLWIAEPWKLSLLCSGRLSSFPIKSFWDLDNHLLVCGVSRSCCWILLLVWFNCAPPLAIPSVFGSCWISELLLELIYVISLCWPYYWQTFEDNCTYSYPLFFYWSLFKIQLFSAFFIFHT